MRAEKITTSVVAIGGGKDEKFLQALAVAGGGQYFLADKAGKLPQIFTQDVAMMARSAIEEGVFLPESMVGEEILGGIAPASVPALYAYCISELRPLAQLGMRSPKDDPILAKWQYGLGTSLAFASDAKAQWAAEWMGWEAFGQFWAQAVRALSRRTAQNDYVVDTRRVGGRGEITIDAYDSLGNPLMASDLSVRVANPDGSSQEVRLTQQAPGEYVGDF